MVSKMLAKMDYVNRPGVNLASKKRAKSDLVAHTRGYPKQWFCVSCPKPT
jgi:hypothetical protein